MAGISKCPHCGRTLVGVVVEAVSMRGPLPAHFRLFAASCSNCHTALGSFVVDTTPPTVDKRGVHGASVAEPQRNPQLSVQRKLQRLLGDDRASY
jgi:hypothetical protein